MELILAGNMSYTQRGMTQIVQAGELFVLRAGPHRYEVGPAGFMHKRYITIGGPLLDNMLEKVGLGQQSRVQLKDPARIEYLFRRVRQIAVRNAPGHQIDLAVLLCRILIEIGRSTQPEHPFAVSKVIEFLRRDVAHNPSLAELAKVAGMSQSHFSRVFKNSVGMSPLRYLDHLKMREAGRLLFNTDIKITEIAQAVGIANPLYLSRKFKNYLGSSPTKLRAARRTDGRRKWHP